MELQIHPQNKDPSNNSWNSSTLALLTDQLIKHLDPIAKEFMKRGIKNSKSATELGHYLAEKLPTEKQKDTLLSNMKKIIL